jgi:polyhydroxybutyrate depolymerase
MEDRRKACEHAPVRSQAMKNPLVESAEDGRSFRSVTSHRERSGRPRAMALACLAVLSTVGGARAADSSAPGCALEKIEHGPRLERSIDVNGVQRQYILHVPANIRPGAAAPLLFDFHGFNHSGAGVWRVSGFKELAEKHGFITVYPTGLPITLTLRGEPRNGAGWEMRGGADNRDLAFTRAMLSDIAAAYCIDRERIFSTGFSNGAFFTSLLGCTMSETFAAVAPVGGGPLRSRCQPTRPLPVLIHNGVLDELIPIDFARRGRDQWIAANRCSGTDGAADAPTCQTATACAAAGAVVYCEGEYTHTWPADATERIWSFFAAHPRHASEEAK